MDPRTGMVCRATCLLALLGALPGCSLLFVTKAPPPSPARVRDAQDQPKKVSRSKACTTSQFAPIVDSVVGGYQVYRTIYAVTAADSAYSNVPISRGADIVLGLAFTALFVGSASYGFAATHNCRELREHEAAEGRARPNRVRRTVPAGPDDPSEEASPAEPENEPRPAASVKKGQVRRQELDEAQNKPQTPAVDADGFSPW